MIRVHIPINIQLTMWCIVFVSYFPGPGGKTGPSDIEPSRQGEGFNGTDVFLFFSSLLKDSLCLHGRGITSLDSFIENCIPYR